MDDEAIRSAHELANGAYSRSWLRGKSKMESVQKQLRLSVVGIWTLSIWIPASLLGTECEVKPGTDEWRCALKVVDRQAAIKATKMCASMRRLNW